MGLIGKTIHSIKGHLYELDHDKKEAKQQVTSKDGKTKNFQSTGDSGTYDSLLKHVDMPVVGSKAPQPAIAPASVVPPVAAKEKVGK